MSRLSPNDNTIIWCNALPANYKTHQFLCHSVYISLLFGYYFIEKYCPAMVFNKMMCSKSLHCYVEYPYDHNVVYI